MKLVILVKQGKSDMRFLDANYEFVGISIYQIPFEVRGIANWYSSKFSFMVWLDIGILRRIRKSKLAVIKRHFD